MSTLLHNFFMGCYYIDDQALAFIASNGHDLLSTLSMLFRTVFIARIDKGNAVIRLLIGSNMLSDCIELPSLAHAKQTKLARQCSGNIFLLQCKMSGPGGALKKTMTPGDRGLSFHVLNTTFQHTDSTKPEE